MSTNNGLVSFFISDVMRCYDAVAVIADPHLMDPLLLFGDQIQ